MNERWSVVGRNHLMQRVIIYPPEREAVAQAHADDCAERTPRLVWSVEPWEPEPSGKVAP